MGMGNRRAVEKIRGHIENPPFTEVKENKIVRCNSLRPGRLYFLPFVI